MRSKLIIEFLRVFLEQKQAGAVELNSLSRSGIVSANRTVALFYISATSRGCFGDSLLCGK